MKRLLVLLLLLTPVRPTHAGEMTEAKVLLQQIQEQGAQATIDSIWGKPAWDEMIQHVVTGSVEWLTVAGRLHPASDAGSSSWLRDAVAWTLPKVSEQVLLKISENSLAQAPNDLFTLRICDGPPVDFPNDDHDTYYNESLSAVHKVKNVKLKKLRNECLSALKAAAEYMKAKQ